LTQVIDVMSAVDILAGLPDQINEVIVRHVAERPNHPAFFDDGRAWSYREFANAVDAVAADLERLQIRPGDRVLLASENSVALAALVFACSSLNAWPVVANPRLSPRELDLIHVHSGARRILFTTDISKEAAEHAARVNAERRQVGPFAEIAVGALKDGAAGACRSRRCPPGRRTDVHLRRHWSTEGRDAQP
jgi:long-chain acyl-CoA synthetase